jgi:magnesium transporter
MLNIIQIAADGRLMETDSPASVKSQLGKDGTVTWVDMEDGTDEDWNRVLELHPFHPLAVDDCRSNAQRPKLEEYPGHLLIVFQSLQLGPEAQSLETVELDVLFAPDLIVTVRDTPVASVEEVRHKCQSNPKVYARGADRLLHAVLDRTVDYYFPLAETLESRLDGIESDLSDHVDPAVFDRIFTLRKLLLAFRRFVGPQRDIVNALSFRPLPGIREETHIYFRDIYDHLMRIHDHIELMRDLASGVRDAYMTQISHRTNEIIKVLTIMGSVILPLSLIAGAFGMNFVEIPLAKHAAGFWITVGGMGVLGALIYSVFRLRRWV